MPRNLKISGALVALFAVVVAVIALAGAGDDAPPPAAAPVTPTAAAPADVAGAGETDTADRATGTVGAVRTSDPRILGRKGSSGTTFTEFLDFECESCRAAYPLIEQLRRQYAGKITFEIRYFPLDAHHNSRNAAAAVEAAHQQGRLEAMYKRMYETQQEWGEAQDSKADVFRGFAQDLGLDLGEYDADVKAASTKARIQEDVDAGIKLGVTGTPSFFLNGQRLQAETVEDLKAQLDAAAAS